MRKFVSILVAAAVATMVAAPATAGDRYYHERDRDAAAAGILLGIIAGAVVGGAIANDRDNRRYRQYRSAPRYYRVAPQERWGYPSNLRYRDRGGYRYEQPRARQCPNLGHYQGRLVYRGGCYYPG